MLAVLHYAEEIHNADSRLSFGVAAAAEALIHRFPLTEEEKYRHIPVFNHHHPFQLAFRVRVEKAIICLQRLKLLRVSHAGFNPYILTDLGREAVAACTNRIDDGFMARLKTRCQDDGSGARIIAYPEFSMTSDELDARELNLSPYNKAACEQAAKHMHEREERERLERERPPLKITRIISSGQPGAERAGWEAAMFCNVPIGGWAAHGRIAEDGIIPETYTGLREMEPGPYTNVIEANVVGSDATIVFTEGTAIGYSKQVIECAVKHGIPWHHIDLNCSMNRNGYAPDTLTKWLKKDVLRNRTECVLHISGSALSDEKTKDNQLRVTYIMVGSIATLHKSMDYIVSFLGQNDI